MTKDELQAEVSRLRAEVGRLSSEAADQRKIISDLAARPAAPSWWYGPWYGPACWPLGWYSPFYQPSWYPPAYPVTTYYPGVSYYGGQVSVSASGNAPWTFDGNTWSGSISPSVTSVSASGTQTLTFGNVGTSSGTVTLGGQAAGWTGE